MAWGISSFYRRVVFPRLCELALNRPDVAARRRELLEPVDGDILEIGFGTGLNLDCYPARVRRLTAIEPNAGMHGLAKRRLARSAIRLELHPLRGEQMPLADESFDFVVCTFTLCSVADVDRALAETRRVLRRGGRFVFLEHGLHPDPAVRRRQRRWNWLQMRLGDGCRLDRDIPALVAAQGFEFESSQGYQMEGMPKTHGYMHQGIARK